MLIKMEITLDDSSVITIDEKLDGIHDIKNVIVRAVYKSRLDKEETKSTAAMNTAILLGYETPSAVTRVVIS